MKVATVDEMRAMDRAAMETFGIEEAILMEHAGLASTSVLSQQVGGILNKTFIIVSGVGNNGGDGFVVARLIHSAGGRVNVFLIGDADKLRGAAAANYRILKRLPIEAYSISSLEDIRHDVMNCDIIIDAIFGTGLDRDIGGLAAEVIDLLNGSGKRILSLDLPSGINGNTGVIMGRAVRADHTVTFGLPKLGAMLFPGYDCCGKLHCTHISFPPSLYNSADLSIETNDFITLPARNKNAHKSSIGQALFIAGAQGYYGAPYFAAMSFLKAGGGYSRLAAPSSIGAVIAERGSEIVFIPQKETPAGSLSLENREGLLALADKTNVVVIGPGMSLEAETQQLARELIAGVTKPVVVDADGLRAVAADPMIIKKRRAATVLTPHLGEMAALTGKSVAEIEADKISVLKKTASSLNSIIVLKGAHSLIGGPDGRIFINLSGNSGMATAGAGDVLTGAIAAMSALGLAIEEAVRKGVYIHGLAGDLAAGEQGEDGMTAEDILNHLPKAMKLDRMGSGYFEKSYAIPCVNS